MEVLEKPKAKEIWKTTVECNGVTDVKKGCGAKLSISEDDLFRVKVGAVGLEHYVAQYQCPECGARSDYDDYPEPAVLVNYEQHASYQPENDLMGYSIERSWRRRKTQKIYRKFFVDKR